jgi:hypothetical protein
MFLGIRLYQKGIYTMTNTMFQNGLSFLMNQGFTEDKAVSMLKQANKELTALPIANDFESVFFTHLSLAAEIEQYKNKKLLTPKQAFIVKNKRKPIVKTTLESVIDGKATWLVQYE